jgi:pyrroloquinoline quinone biosynthesis protein E
MKLTGQIAMGCDAMLGILGRRRPVNVMASVTDRCPSRCTYCRIPERNRPELDTATWKRLLDEMAAAGTRRIGIWGGEPLVRTDIGEICDHARSLGIYVSLDSNGYLLPKMPGILDSIDHLVLAYDGPREAHDANRQPGSHEKVMAALETASGRVKLWTITVLTRNNIGLMDSIFDTALEYGFLCTFQTLHHNEELGRNPSGLMPSPQEYSEVFSRLLQAKRRGAPIANSSRYLASLSKWPDHCRTTSPDRFHGVRCRAGSMYCNIDVDGRVYPCSLLIGMYPGALNALESGFRKAFEAAGSLPCQACVAGCYTEYNYLYSLDFGVALQWFRSVVATERARRLAARRRGI